jgi:ATP adenylyltransferase
MSSHNTAISRKTASAPLRMLEKLDLLNGSVLDYGCGKGADAKYLAEKGYLTSSYDPHWKPDDIGAGKYDTVLCTFVLNVIEKPDEESLIETLLDKVNEGGRCFVSVRRDVKVDGPTSRGYQRNVLLNYPVVKELKGNYCIYEISK